MTKIYMPGKVYDLSGFFCVRKWNKKQSFEVFLQRSEAVF